MKKLTQHQAEAEMRCDCCHHKFPFRNMVYIEKRKGQDFSYEKRVFHGDKESEARTEVVIIYLTRVWVCKRCRKDKRFDKWGMARVPEPEIRFV